MIENIGIYFIINICIMFYYIKFERLSISSLEEINRNLKYIYYKMDSIECQIKSLNNLLLQNQHQHPYRK